MSKNKRKRKNNIYATDVSFAFWFAMFWWVVVKCSAICVELYEQIGIWLTAMAACYAFHWMFKAYNITKK